MSLVDDLLPDLDRVRGIPGELGLRQYAVSLAVKTWSGARAGMGTATTTFTPIRCAGGAQNPKVRQLTQKDVVASGGVYSDQDFEVGPITPAFAGGGTAISGFEPAQGSSPTEIAFKLTGPGLPTGGAYYAKIGQDVTGNLHYSFILRKTAFTP